MPAFLGAAFFLFEVAVLLTALGVDALTLAWVALTTFFFPAASAAGTAAFTDVAAGAFFAAAFAGAADLVSVFLVAAVFVIFEREFV
jgi:hypothetical protein